MDYFGNQLSFFTMQEPHQELVVEARSEVVVDEDPKDWPERSMPWEEAARAIETDHSAEGLEAYQFVFESPRIRQQPELAEYARRIVHAAAAAGGRRCWI